MKEEKRKVIKEVDFESKNGVPLKLTQYIAIGGYSDGREVWEVTSGEHYVGSVDNAIGEFYSMTFKEVKSPEQLVELYKNRYVFARDEDFIRDTDEDRKYKKPTYMVDLYSGKEITSEQFSLLLKNIKLLLDKGNCVAYNDEHGVGSFFKKGDTYEMTHFRYMTERVEKTKTIKKIGNFLREFFDLGYSYTKNNEWR